MIVKTAYLVQTQVISLGELPLLPKAALRPAFHPIFASPYCFTEMRTAILDWERVEWDDEIGWDVPIPLPSKPFIRGLGQICFNTQSVHMLHRDPFLRPRIAEQLAGCEKYWDPDARPEYPERNLEFFGYDLRLDDQRMYQLHFELRRPIFLKAMEDGRTMADGKIFLHLYPSGYLVLHVALDLKAPNLTNLANLKRALRETRPYRPESAWTWESRLGNHSLRETLEIVRQNTYASIFQDPQSHAPRESRWRFALKTVTQTDWQTIAAHLFTSDYDGIELVRDEYGLPQKEAFLISRQGLISCLSPTRKRGDALRAFWNYLCLYEFALMKDQIYTDYAAYLRAETVKLREYRLSAVRKLSEEDFTKISVYKPEIARYLLALDTHIQNAPSFHRLIYAKISDGTGFSQRRQRVKELLKEWESEIAQWEHTVVLLWKRLASPLRALLGLK